MLEKIAVVFARAFHEGDARTAEFGATAAVAAYAEIHYRFRYFFSFLKRKRPEIIADLPPRIETGGAFPLVITIKDADLYPARIEGVSVEIRRCSDGTVETHIPEFEPAGLTERFTELIFQLPRVEKPGELDLTITIEGHYTASGKRFSITNDNYPSGFRQPFRIVVSGEPLPRSKGWSCGDIHCHSRYTEDQVEFGAGLEGLSRVAAATGYSWAGVTDHSYDLDDLPGNYLENDPSLEKWRRFLEEASELNKLADAERDGDRRTRAFLLPGEEVSCGGAGGWNLHLVLLGNSGFIPGYGDGAEKWFRTTPTLTLEEALDRVVNSGEPIACYAAHPFAKIGRLQRLLFNRGPWKRPDLANGRLHGWQLWNRREVDDPDVLCGLSPWIKMLLEGKRIALAAGSDSHGNFGAERSIRVPFLSLRAIPRLRWSKIWTAVEAAPEAGSETIIAGLISGKTIVSNGPFASISACGHGSVLCGIGGEIHWKKGMFIRLEALSTVEFGPISGGAVFLGVIGESEERILGRVEPPPVDEPDDNMFVLADFSLPDPATFRAEGGCRGYVRGEVRTAFDGELRKCWTSPLYLANKAADQPLSGIGIRNGE